MSIRPIVGGVHKTNTINYAVIDSKHRNITDVYSVENGIYRRMWSDIPKIYEYITDTTFTVSQTMTVDFFLVGGGGGGAWTGGHSIQNPNMNGTLGEWRFSEINHWGAGGSGGLCITKKTISLIAGDVVQIIIGKGGTGGYGTYYSTSPIAQSGGSTSIRINGNTIGTALGGTPPTTYQGGIGNPTQRPYVNYEYAGAGGNAYYSLIAHYLGQNSITNKYTPSSGVDGFRAFGDVDGAFYGGGGSGATNINITSNITSGDFSTLLGGSGGGAGYISYIPYAAVPNSGGGGCGITDTNVSSSYMKGADGIVLMRKSK